MSNMMNEGLNKANSVANDFKGKVLAAENQLETMSKNAGERAGAMVSNFASTTTDYARVGRDYVQENPVKGVAIAAATGALAGCLLTLALRSRRQ